MHVAPMGIASFEQVPLKRNVLKHEKATAHRLLKANFELVAKSLKLSDVLGIEVNIFSDHRAEFLMAETAISIFLKCPIDLNNKIFNCTSELIASQFMDEYAKNTADDYSSMVEKLSSKILKLLIALEVRVSSPWELGGKEEFFVVVNEFFPDGGCDYFRKSYASYFASPLATRF